MASTNAATMPNSGKFFREDGSIGYILDAIEMVGGSYSTYQITELEVGGGGCVGMNQLSHFGQPLPPSPLTNRRFVRVFNASQNPVVITMVDLYQHGYDLPAYTAIDFNCSSSGMTVYGACDGGTATLKIWEFA